MSNITEDVEILWRIGEYVIRFKDQEGKMRKLTLPSEQVKGLATIESRYCRLPKSFS